MKIDLASVVSVLGFVVFFLLMLLAGTAGECYNQAVENARLQGQMEQLN